jgi:malate dehydrogenase (quinone)
MVPSLGVKLSENQGLFAEVWDWTSRVLQLEEPVPVA